MWAEVAWPCLVSCSHSGIEVTEQQQSFTTGDLPDDHRNNPRRPWLGIHTQEKADASSPLLMKNMYRTFILFCFIYLKNLNLICSHSAYNVCSTQAKSIYKYCNL